eukprot:scaffold8146_cov157-Skeletonema_menzelii.AAC.8
MVWTDLNEIDWDELNGNTLMLKPQDVELVGNVLCNFVTLDGEDPGLERCGGKSDGGAGALPEDPSPGSRSLASVSTRLVSAALRLFVGI